ncbi:MAG: hypothetical protein AAF483_14065, partial [Planctomycetota bacterium]
RCYRKPETLQLNPSKPSEVFGHLYLNGWGQQKPSEAAAKHAIPPPYPVSEQAWTSTSAHGRDYRLEVKLVLLGTIQEFEPGKLPPQSWYCPPEMLERYEEAQQNETSN